MPERKAVAQALLDGEVVTQDPRFKPFVERVVSDMNGQLSRLREQWVDGKISDEVVTRRAQTLKQRAQDKISKRIPMRQGAPMTGGF